MFRKSKPRNAGFIAKIFLPKMLFRNNVNLQIKSHNGRIPHMFRESLKNSEAGVPPQEQLRTSNLFAALDIILARHPTIVLPTAREDLRKIQASLKLEASWGRSLDPSHRTYPIPIDVASRFRLTDDQQTSDGKAIDSLLRDFGFGSGVAEIHKREELMGLINDHEYYRRVSKLPTKFQGVTLEASKDLHTGWRYLKAHLDDQAAIAAVQSSDLKSEESEHIMQTLHHYYDAIDQGDVDSALALFSNDEQGEPVAVYKRGSSPERMGMGRLRKFYEEERIIEAGHHELEQVVVYGQRGEVRGRLVGKLKSEDRQVNVEFCDRFEFLNGKVIHRVTSFPGREI